MDVFDGAYERLFDSNLSAFQSRVKKIKALSQDGLRTLAPKSFDFIYIDGSHVAKDVFIDTALSWDLLKPEGFIIFGDYNWTGRAGHNYGTRRIPKAALDKFLMVFEPYLEIEHKDYQLIVRKRSKPDYNRRSSWPRQTKNSVRLAPRLYFSSRHRICSHHCRCCLISLSLISISRAALCRMVRLPDLEK